MTERSWRRSDRATLFHDVPSGIAVLDRGLTIVDQNRNFSEVFGEQQGVSCYSAIKGRSKPCEGCPAELTFEDGQPRVVEQVGTTHDGRQYSYLVQITATGNGNVRAEHVAAITTDLTPTKRLESEYQTLFEKVPCFVAVINRDHRVVKANEAFRRVFGEPTGEHCYRLYKRRFEPCADCPVDRTFLDGASHSSQQMGVSHAGKPTPYLVFTAPLRLGKGGVTHVIEMALDMTKHHDLEEQLSRANVLRLALVEGSLDAIVVFDADGRILLVNQAAERLFGVTRQELVGRRTVLRNMPRELRRVLKGEKPRLLLHESVLTTMDGEQVPVRIAATALEYSSRFKGVAAIIQDLREIRQLEREKLDAERLAAVGQTVAGLAHGIKNILMGLEGGMYATSSGLKRGDQARVQRGWEMLSRNMNRISDLAKNLLAFSRGDRLKCQIVLPSQVVHDAIELFRESALQHGIGLIEEVDEQVRGAWMDPEGLHTCVVNLISNALDACQASEKGSCTVRIGLKEKGETIVLEVSDTGCGMDYQVKQKVFTSFFTTKGTGGTGLGLLLTRKIVQQLGGSIDVTSTVGEGTTFRVTFLRDRLPQPERTENGHEPSTPGTEEGNDE